MVTSRDFAMGAGLCRCGRRRRWRDALFEGLFGRQSRTDQVCGAKQRQGDCGLPIAGAEATIYLHHPLTAA